MVERVEMKKDGMYQVHDSLHHRKEVHQEESAAGRSAPGDTAECCSVSEISIYCFFTPSRTNTSNPSRGVSTNCHSPLTLSSSTYGLLESYAMSAELHGVTQK